MVNPYKNSSKSKKAQVAEMFNNIAKNYVLLNNLISFGIDKYWRKEAIKTLLSKNNFENPLFIDVACGTADFAIALMKIENSKVIGADISEEMMKEGRKIISKKNLDNRINLEYGDAENLDYKDNNFDGAVCAFGVRNFENLEKGLAEIYRVIKPNKNFIILELSEPKTFPIKQLYKFHSKVVLPFIGRLISKDNSAYTYLPNSISSFKKGQELVEVMENVGFKNCYFKNLTFGVVSIYVGEKTI